MDKETGTIILFFFFLLYACVCGAYEIGETATSSNRGYCAYQGIQLSTLGARFSNVSITLRARKAVLRARCLHLRLKFLVDKTSRADIRAKHYANFLETLILKNSSGPQKLPGFSRNGPLAISLTFVSWLLLGSDNHAKTNVLRVAAG